MRDLILGMSMSLDGFVAGPNDENDWIFSTGSPDGKAWKLRAPAFTSWAAARSRAGRRNLAPPPARWSAEKRAAYREEAIAIADALAGASAALDTRIREKIEDYRAYL